MVLLVLLLLAIVTTVSTGILDLDLGGRADLEVHEASVALARAASSMDVDVRMVADRRIDVVDARVRWVLLDAEGLNLAMLINANLATELGLGSDGAGRHGHDGGSKELDGEGLLTGHFTGVVITTTMLKLIGRHG